MDATLLLTHSTGVPKALPIRNRLIAAILCLFALTVADGCRKKAAATGLFPVTLQTDWYPQPEMGGFYQAQLQGLYRAAGLDVTIVPGGPYINADQQVATGAAQFAMGSSDQVLVRVARGLPLVAVAATMQQDPQALLLHDNSPVRDFPDLEGHTVAAKPGSIWFQYLLKRYNLKNIREIPATYSIANFLEDPGYIQQAFVTSEPYFAEKAGAHVRTMLISSTGYQPYRVFFTSRQFLSEHPEIVQKFVEASLEGWRNYLQDPAATDAELSRLNPAMSTDQMRFSVQTLKDRHFIDGAGTSESHLGSFTAERWSTLYRQLVDLKVITQTIDPASAYTLQFVH
jgi:NitT/TauT family transport system substrate-binding protein